MVKTRTTRERAYTCTAGLFTEYWHFTTISVVFDTYYRPKFSTCSFSYSSRTTSARLDCQTDEWMSGVWGRSTFQPESAACLSNHRLRVALPRCHVRHVRRPDHVTGVTISVVCWCVGEHAGRGTTWRLAGHQRCAFSWAPAWHYWNQPEIFCRGNCDNNPACHCCSD